MSLTQLSLLLPLPDDELRQVLDYAAGLSKSEAAKHFHDLLGESPAAIEFISAFNGKRQDPGGLAAGLNSSIIQAPSLLEAVPKSKGKKKKAQQQLHTPAPRRIDGFSPAPGAAYTKKNQEDDYITSKPGPASQPMSRNGSQGQPGSQPGSGANTPPKELMRTAAGYLISDATHGKSRSSPASRSSTPKPGSSGSASPKPGKSPAKVNITGGTPMAGASTAITDLDNAIRSLEVSTNPTLGSAEDRRCDCNATRHPLLAAAPNCLNCGKIVCVKEGLAPCTYCGSPILTAVEVRDMIRELRSERGRERQALDRAAHKRPEISMAPLPFSQHKSPSASAPEVQSDSEAEARARALEHRDRLLSFQAQNARRTTVRDEAADFDVTAAMAGGGAGTGSMWASPEERARELKRQQKVLRDIEWNARPEYDRRRQVVSIDLVGGKVVKRMAAVPRPQSPEEPSDQNVEPGEDVRLLEDGAGNAGRGGVFSHNPLVGGLIRPVYDVKGKGTELEGRRAKATWRRVQDGGDNADVILDGGVYGHNLPTVVITSGDEPACG